MLGLSCLPCSDTNAVSLSRANPQLVVLAPHPSENAHLDLCSPFCTCSCCSVTQSNPNIFLFELIILKPLLSYRDYYSSASPLTIALPIWQPPQLAS